MFVLANGAFKSGSTWLYTILRTTGYFAGLPDAYTAGPGTGRNWLKPSLVKDFLESGVYRDAHYLVKGHHYHKHTSLARAENVQKGFTDYYWRLGRYKAQQITTYHEVWNVASPKVYVSSFEWLKNDFDGLQGARRQTKVA